MFCYQFIQEVRADVPPSLGLIVNTMLASDPAERYQSALEVADALQASETEPEYFPDVQIAEMKIDNGHHVTAEGAGRRLDTFWIWLMLRPVHIIFLVVVNVVTNNANAFHFYSLVYFVVDSCLFVELNCV